MRHWCKTDDPQYLAKLALRLRQKTNVKDGCHEWRGATVAGYGQIKVANRNTLAHRVAYQLASGPIPDGMDVLHRCDNPGCVNPEHLFLGGHKANMSDKAQKGRAPSKLSASDIPLIRRHLADGRSLCSIAKAFGVGHHAIGDIRDGVTWHHLPREVVCDVVVADEH